MPGSVAADQERSDGRRMPAERLQVPMSGRGEPVSHPLPPCPPLTALRSASVGASQRWPKGGMVARQPCAPLD